MLTFTEFQSAGPPHAVAVLSYQENHCLFLFLKHTLPAHKQILVCWGIAAVCCHSTRSHIEKRNQSVSPSPQRVTSQQNEMEAGIPRKHSTIVPQWFDQTFLHKRSDLRSKFRLFRASGLSERRILVTCREMEAELLYNQRKEAPLE